MNAPRCSECQDRGRIRIVMRIGEYSHEREEYCKCAVGRKMHAESKEPTPLEEPETN